MAKFNAVPPQALALDSMVKITRAEVRPAWQRGRWQHARESGFSHLVIARAARELGSGKRKTRERSPLAELPHSAVPLEDSGYGCLRTPRQ